MYDVYFWMTPVSFAHASVSLQSNGVVIAAMIMNTLNTLHVARQNIAHRAKCRIGQGGVAPIELSAQPSAVPHPKNWGGDPVKSIRTMQPSDSVVRDGCDPIEANANAVAVEQNPHAISG